MIDTSQVMISAYAKLPANTTVEEVYKTMVVTVVVNMNTSVILEAEVSLITEVSKHFISRMLIDYPMNQGPALLLEHFEKIYFGSSKKAIESAIRMLFSKYEEIKSRN